MTPKKRSGRGFCGLPVPYRQLSRTSLYSQGIAAKKYTRVEASEWRDLSYPSPVNSVSRCTGSEAIAGSYKRMPDPDRVHPVEKGGFNVGACPPRKPMGTTTPWSVRDP